MKLTFEVEAHQHGGMTTRVLLDGKDVGTAAKSTLHETYVFMGKLMFAHTGNLDWVKDELADREAARAYAPPPARPKAVASPPPAAPPAPNGHDEEAPPDLPKFATRPREAQTAEGLISELARGLERGAHILLLIAIPAALAVRHVLGA